MLTLPTAILRHDTGADRHYDWLMGSPPWDATVPADRLWTARVSLPLSAWSRGRTWQACEIAPHRRVYLTHQGPIRSDGPSRGSVFRIARGHVTVARWLPHHRVLRLTLPSLAGTVVLHRLDAAVWQACWLGQTP